MGVSIKEVRSKLGLTQKQMAIILGSEQPSIARIEAGKRTETKRHHAHLTAIELIGDNNLLESLQERLEKQPENKERTK